MRVSKEFVGAMEISHLNTTIANDIDRQRHFEIIWSLNGDGSMQIGERQFPLKENRIYCLPPGNKQQLIATPAIEGYHLSFTPEFILAEAFSLLQQPIPMEGIYINDTEKEQLLFVLQQIEKEYRQRSIRRMHLLTYLVNIFLIYLSRSIPAVFSENLPNRHIRLVQHFRELIRKHFTEKKAVADYADILCVSPSYLSRVVKNVTGFSAIYHINRELILEAKHKAMHTPMNMKEIAACLGFNDYAHFSKFFKTNSGMSFTDFRKTLS